MLVLTMRAGEVTVKEGEVMHFDLSLLPYLRFIRRFLIKMLLEEYVKSFGGEVFPDDRNVEEKGQSGKTAQN